MSDFIWKNKTLKTMGEVLAAVSAVQTREEAQAFLAAYEKITPHARANIGYGLGYMDRAETERLAALFEGCNHPVFGEKFGRGAYPTSEEAFAIGVAEGRKARK